MLPPIHAFCSCAHPSDTQGQMGRSSIPILKAALTLLVGASCGQSAEDSVTGGTPSPRNSARKLAQPGRHYLLVSVEKHTCSSIHVGQIEQYPVSVENRSEGFPKRERMSCTCVFTWADEVYMKCIFVDSFVVSACPSMRWGRCSVCCAC